MDKEASGYVWVDVYLLLEKVTFNNFNVSITDKGITLDMLLSEFEDLDSYSLPDLYAGARRDVERYADALKEPLNDILRPLFENHTAVMSDDASTNDIIVFKNGCVWVSRHFRAYVVGQNPKLPKEKLNEKIEQELSKYLDKEIAGISPEFIYTTVVPAIK
jgi:hypothetical protein